MLLKVMLLFLVVTHTNIKQCVTDILPAIQLAAMLEVFATCNYNEAFDRDMYCACSHNLCCG